MLRGSEALEITLRTLRAYRARFAAYPTATTQTGADQLRAIDAVIAALLAEQLVVRAGIVAEAVYDAPHLPDLTPSDS